MNKNEQASVGQFGYPRDGRSTAVAGQGGVFFPAIGEVALVNQDIDTLDMREVRRVVLGGRVRDVGQRPARPVQAIAQTAAGMLEGEVGQTTALGQVDGP